MLSKYTLFSCLFLVTIFRTFLMGYFFTVQWTFRQINPLFHSKISGLGAAPGFSLCSGALPWWRSVGGSNPYPRFFYDEVDFSQNIAFLSNPSLTPPPPTHIHTYTRHKIYKNCQIPKMTKSVQMSPPYAFFVIF